MAKKTAPKSARAAVGLPARTHPSRDEALRTACAEFGSDFYPLVEEGSQLVDGGRKTQLRAMYKLGKLIAKAATRYQRDSTNLLAAAWDLSSDMIRLYRQLAERYTQDQVNECLTLCKPSGAALDASYFVYGVRIADPEKRMAMLRQAASRGLTASQFNEQVTALNGSSREPASRLPGSLTAVVRQLDRRVAAIIDLSDEDDLERLGDLAADIPPDKVTAEQVAEIDAAVERLDSLAKRADDVKEALVTAKARLSRVLEASAGDGKAAKAAPKALPAPATPKAAPAARPRIARGTSPTPKAGPIRPKSPRRK